MSLSLLIDGALLSSGHLVRLDGFAEGIRVVVRSEWCQVPRQTRKVAVICGGGSGHEPAHAGYVGRGGLTAAVCGDVFASPSVDAVVAAIRATAGARGVLLVVTAGVAYLSFRDFLDRQEQDRGRKALERDLRERAGAKWSDEEAPPEKRPSERANFKGFGD